MLYVNSVMANQCHKVSHDLIPFHVCTSVEHEKNKNIHQKIIIIIILIRTYVANKEKNLFLGIANNQPAVERVSRREFTLL